MGTLVDTCKLCGRHALLQRSHIVPEFVFKPLYLGSGPDHWMAGVRLNEDGSADVRRLQKPLREKLLCRQCEQHLNRHYEQPSVPLWNHLAFGAPIPQGVSRQVQKMPNGTEVTRLLGVDYASWKLFLLSLLWRASIARGATWAGVQLGESDEEQARAMLKHSDPGQQDDFFCLAFTIAGSPLAMRHPGRVEWDGEECFAFQLTGVKLFFFPHANEPTRKFAACSVSPEGTLISMELDPSELPEFNEMISYVRRARDLTQSRKERRLSEATAPPKKK